MFTEIKIFIGIVSEAKPDYIILINGQLFRIIEKENREFSIMFKIVLVGSTLDRESKMISLHKDSYFKF